jgi:hypothetical protein
MATTGRSVLLDTSVVVRHFREANALQTCRRFAASSVVRRYIRHSLALQRGQPLGHVKALDPKAPGKIEAMGGVQSYVGIEPNHLAILLLGSLFHPPDQSLTDALFSISLIYDEVIDLDKFAAP